MSIKAVAAVCSDEWTVLCFLFSCNGISCLSGTNRSGRSQKKWEAAGILVWIRAFHDYFPPCSSQTVCLNTGKLNISIDLCQDCWHVLESRASLRAGECRHIWKKSCQNHWQSNLNGWFSISSLVQMVAIPVKRINCYCYRRKRPFSWNLWRDISGLHPNRMKFYKDCLTVLLPIWYWFVGL